MCFKQVKTPPGKHFISISAGHELRVWAVTQDHKVLKYRGLGRWKLRDPSIPMVRVSVGADGAVFGLGEDGRVFEWGGMENRWRPLPTPVPFKQISVGTSNSVWAVTENHQLYRWQTAKWQCVAEGVFDISAAGDMMAVAIPVTPSCDPAAPDCVPPGSPCPPDRASSERAAAVKAKPGSAKA
eukprot:TRINITY_DN18915_c0_g1_i1.p2 TRINITY_DN18915_c0_g1~~TRINITY_DN18915_c0_g1_i1.p2  ORF type:complete len:183 (-),score=23.96 TRINITY_DN18915_c0_g1_i1:76-624(-)